MFVCGKAPERGANKSKGEGTKVFRPSAGIPEFLKGWHLLVTLSFISSSKKSL